jgi:hypothetical protein
MKGEHAPNARPRINIMLNRLWISSALIMAALSLPLTGTAQKFQQPTKEELQMTSDPKAPGAEAVFLYRQVEADNRNHYTAEYARIKVLTEKGKEWATVEVPYIPGFSDPPYIEGRTIHADGTVIPLTGNASDLLVEKTTSSHVKVSVFNLPSVEVGSILEYKWSVPLTGGKVSGTHQDEEDYYGSALAGTIPVWEVQQPIFIHKEHFYWNPYSNLSDAPNGGGVTMLVDGEEATHLLSLQRLPAGVTTTRSPKGDFTLDIQDVPAFIHESDATPENGLRYSVHFYWTPYISADIFWQNETERWSKKLDKFASGGGSAIGDQAARVLAGVTTPEAKARKLYDFVQSLDNTDYSRAKSESERRQLHLKKELTKAQDVLNEKSGSSNDIAALYMALARDAGLSVDGLQVADRNWRLFDPAYLSLSQLDTLLVVLHIDGKDIYLDPGEKLCPFGQLSWKHLMAGGIQQNVKGPVYTPSNLTKDAITAHKADLTVDAQGGITGSVALIMNGPVALRYRQLNLTSDTDEVKRQLNESLTRLLPQGVTGEVDKIQGLDNPADFLTATLKVSGQLGTTTGKRLLLPAFFFSTGARPQFVAEEKRTAAVDLHYAEQVIDDAVFHLPAGYTVESAPQTAQLPWEGHAQLIVKTTPGAGSIEIKHVFARAFMLLDPKEYPALRDYYQKLAATDQQQLVLVK